MHKSVNMGAGTGWLALAYLLYFGQLGVLVPYLALFLDGRGLDSTAIGELLALITLARILGPTLWANLADSSGKCLRILQLGCLLASLSFLFIFIADDFWSLALCFGLVLMFWTAIMPQMEVITLNSVEGNASRYSRIRLWGSLGFILLTVLAGRLIDWYGTEVLIFLCSGLLLSLLLVSLRLQEPPQQQIDNEPEGPIWDWLRAPVFIGFILAACLLQVSFGPYNSFFTLYMKDLGYSGMQTGLLLSVGVVAEIVIFMLAGRLIGRFGVKRVLYVSLLLTALRWYVMASLAHVQWLLILSQLFHAASFGLTHAASVHFIHRYFGRRFQSRGQALYVSLATGLGGALGNYGAGHLWQQGKGAELTFLCAAAVVTLAALVVMLLPRQQLQGERRQS
ncbi:MFS transporter [Aliiglaciecola sp. CAU 1673]|uniref:MFS transporter n=1 Tax=Aliiglaciecola sp. CAU 1673 TaxID=3032595 RepID=UPI0023DBF7E9|nr:MFS transporter [Aliiglaciecola sp. CAU 1673]MDF2178040.1 MFS transporter [Aliiglaciecola sp. CAU 1673]